MNGWDSRELLLAMRRREPGAVARVYDAYSRRVFGLAVRILGDYGAAEEAVQDAFVDVWQNAERLDPARGNLESLLLTIVRFKSIDRLRKRRGQPVLHEAVDMELLQETSVDGSDPGAYVVDRRNMASALEKLPGEQRTAVELAYFDGYTHVEIAAMLEIPLGTVKSRLRLALERLRTVLGEREEVSDLPRG